jgi:hypothetical protein
MHKFILTFFICFSHCCFAQQDVLIVKQNMQTQQNAWNTGNIDSFMKYYWNSDSLKFIGSKGITYGWQKTLDNYKKSYPTKEAMGELTFTLLETKLLSKEYIYVIGKWALSKEKPVSGHFTLLWKRIKNNWVIIADHTS